MGIMNIIKWEATCSLCLLVCMLHGDLWHFIFLMLGSESFEELLLFLLSIFSEEDIRLGIRLEINYYFIFYRENHVWLWLCLFLVIVRVSFSRCLFQNWVWIARKMLYIITGRLKMYSLITILWSTVSPSLIAKWKF